ncbi:MAG: hypothetical protein LBT31_00165 [Synergistaceae bacterium]|jgi:hypothetical protein|nr:hypothetical protein [Synergistaceae bacterium]
MKYQSGARFTRVWAAWKAAFVVILICASIAAATGRAGADSPSSAIASPLGSDPSFLYIDLSDAAKIADRLRKSEIARVFLDPSRLGSDYVMNLLKNFPARELSLMISFSFENDFDLQVACGFAPDKRVLLDKVARGLASAEETRGLFGDAVPESGQLTIHEPNSTEGQPFYMIEPEGIWSLTPYFSSAREILVFGESPETVARSIEAIENRAARFSPKKEPEWRNSLIFRLGSDISSYFAIDSQKPEAILLGGDISFLPGGWNFDFNTNAIRVMLGETRATDSVRGAGAFLSAGGGKLVLALDEAFNLNLLTSEALGLVGDNAAYEPVITRIAHFLSEVISPGLADDLEAAVASMERFNFAMTTEPDDPATDIRAYFALRSGEAGAVKRAGRELASALDSYGEAPGKGALKITRAPNENWEAVYEIESHMDGRPLTFTIATGEDSLFVGTMPASLLSEPFAADSELFGALAGDDLAEMIYVDSALLRRILRMSIEGKGAGWLSKEFALPLIYFLTDFREIGVRSYSSSRFRLEFKTGGQDFDDWAFIRAAGR